MYINNSFLPSKHGQSNILQMVRSDNHGNIVQPEIKYTRTLLYDRCCLSIIHVYKLWDRSYFGSSEFLYFSFINFLVPANLLEGKYISKQGIEMYEHSS